MSTGQWLAVIVCVVCLLFMLGNIVYHKAKGHKEFDE